MTRKRWLVVGLVMAAIAIGVVVLNAMRPIVVVSPQVFVSPLTRMHFPIVANNHRQSKKCVALSIGYDTAKMLELGARCTYVYGSKPADFSNVGIEVLGMVYPDAITVTGSAPYFMGYNEPDLGLGITPQMAAEMWPQIIAANPGKMAVSPGVSEIHPEWLDQFYQAHLSRWGYPPKLDALAIHCYKNAEVCIRIVSQVIGYAERWGVPQVWVTEFAFSDVWQINYPAGATWQSEARRFIDWMDAQPRITRYYWWALAYDSDEPKQWWNYGWFTQLYDWHAGGLNERGRFYQSIR
jgi:hypothetical protein